MSVTTFDPATIDPAESLIIALIAIPLLLTPFIVSPATNVPSRYTNDSFKLPEAKSITFALALEVDPVTIVPVAKKVGSTIVTEGNTGSESSSDSYTACNL